MTPDSPWLTDEQQRTWRRWLAVNDQLPAALHRELQADSDLSLQDFDVLVKLTDDAEGRVRVSELARTMHWERSRLSHHLGRMEKRGLIERVECATDSRGAEVVLTADGARIFRNATAPHARAIKQHFADALSPAQFDALDDILRTIATHLEATR